MKYVIYLRVSTDQQALSGLGMQGQREICLSYISKVTPGSQSVLEFMDEGYCGSLKIEKRPALLAALSALSPGDVLLVAKRDRLGRDVIVNAMIERDVQRRKAFLISASGDVRDDDDPTSILMRRMVDAFAEYERLIIGARTKVALQIKKSKGQRVGYIPYGYRLCTDNVHIEKDDKEQTILSMISDLRRDGLSLRLIASELNKRAVYNRMGNEWKHVSVSRVMK